MREVEHEVVGVGNLERLDLLGLMADLANSGLEVNHPLLVPREKTDRAILLLLTANRGLCQNCRGLGT